MAESSTLVRLIRRFVMEVRRRRVVRVAAAYLAIGWLVIEMAATIPAALGLPDWVLPLVIVLIGIGFPLAVGLAWAYDLEPDGIVRTQPAVEAGAAAAPPAGAGDVQPSGSVRGEAVGEIRSIAVLPFTNLSADEDNEYLSDGLTEELLNMLAKVGGLRVPGRSSVFALKGRGMDAREAGRHLDVGALLSGSVRRSGNRLRITAELVDATSGFQLWSERYDREAGEIFAIQDDIANAIAERLLIRLRPAAGEASLYRAPTASVGAYHEYLRGRYHLNRRTRHSLQLGLQAFQRAIAADAQFARAYSGLADTYLLLERYGVLPAAESIPQAKAAAHRALAAEPLLAEAHNSLAYALMIGDWDWEAADSAFARAVELDPGYAPAHHWRSWHLARAGRADEAIASMQRAAALEPLSLIINANLGTAFYFARRFEEAIRQLENTLELNPDFPVALQWLGRALEQSGRTAEAVAAQQRAAALLPGDPECVASVGHALARHGDVAGAETQLAELHRLAGECWVSAYWPALVLLGLERVPEAVARLAQAVEERFDWVVFLGVDPVFDPLRAEPAFQQLVERIG